jgi:hypothetical protein
MVQGKPGASWREATELYSLPGYPPVLPDLSGIALDSRGYATVVPASDPSLATTPSGLPAGFSRYYDTALSHPGVPASPGYSNPIVATERAAIRAAPRYGWRVTDQLRPASFPIYALRLAGGGAAVVYATSEKYGWQATSARATLNASQSAVGTGAAPDPYTLRELHVTSARVGLRVTYSVVDEHLAIDPLGHGTVADFFNGKTTALTKS